MEAKDRAVAEEDIKVVLSEIAYNMRSGPRKDITEHKTSEKNYFIRESVAFKINELKQLKETDAILSVNRQ